MTGILEQIVATKWQEIERAKQQRAEVDLQRDHGVVRVEHDDRAGDEAGIVDHERAAGLRTKPALHDGVLRNSRV